jgi:hypothetical protein
MWLIKGTVLGSVIFVIFLFVVVYQRLRHGLSTTLSELPLILWQEFLVCLAVGCLISYVIALIFKRRAAPKA